MSPVKCIYLAQTDRQSLSLRRFAAGPCPGMPGQHSYHNAWVYYGEFDTEWDTETKLASGHCFPKILNFKVPYDDPRWPTKCDKCDYHFKDGEEPGSPQHFTETIYIDEQTGIKYTLRNAPVCSIWNAWWYENIGETNPNPDGLYLMARCPDGHDWYIDGRASNCDSPCKKCGIPYKDHPNSQDKCHYEDSRPHKCWVRHGTPPMLTVDKNGVTCGAGAGSIATGKYHGFLRNGEFT